MSVYVEPILAYRAWSIDPNGARRRVLYSTGVAHFWPPMQVVPAACWEPHKAPESACDESLRTAGCGYYAMKQPPKQQSPAIQGEVYLWGKVIEHEDGYRAEYAYPAAIYSDSPYATELAALYGVPVKEPPYEPDRQALEDNPGGTNHPAGATTTVAATTTGATYTIGTRQNPYTINTLYAALAQSLASANPPAVAPRARKGARLRPTWLTALFALGIGLNLVSALNGSNAYYMNYFSWSAFGLCCIATFLSLKPLHAPDGKS